MKEPRTGRGGWSRRAGVLAAASLGLVLALVVTVGRPLAVVVLPGSVRTPPPRTPDLGEAASGDGWDYWTGVGDPQEVDGTFATVMMVIIAAVVALVVVLVVRAVHRAAADLTRDAVPTASPVTTWDRVLAVDGLRSAVDDAVTEIDSGAAAEGILACWLGLERTAEGLGSGRAPAETSAEFVARLLVDVHVDPAPVERLAGLFREARFSRHAMTERDRDGAREALVAIRRDLDRPGQPDGSGQPDRPAHPDWPASRERAAS